MWIDYDSSDRSEGTGGAVFDSERGAHRAIKQFNGQPIEGLAIRLKVRSFQCLFEFKNELFSISTSLAIGLNESLAIY